MYQTKRTFVKPDMKMSDLIIENPGLLLMMEHFEMDFNVDNKSVAQICSENKTSLIVFLSICNLYNGFALFENNPDALSDVPVIIKFLKNSHVYYKQDKFPEIQNFIKQLYSNNDVNEIKLVEKFFNGYYDEVIEHLDYEDKIAFPYFCELIKQENDSLSSLKKRYSVKEYREHHSDIESKLVDLKNLVLKHISLKGNYVLRRKFLFSLFELESDLNTHSLIEEKILIPLIDKIEKADSRG